MRNNAGELIRIVAGIMFVLGMLGMVMFKYHLVPCLSSIFSSFVVFGFSYIVDAACKYLNKCEYEEFSKAIKKTEE